MQNTCRIQVGRVGRVRTEWCESGESGKDGQGLSRLPALDFRLCAFWGGPLGVPFTEVWYSDICPRARRVSELNRLEQNEPCVEYGDIMERDFDEIAQHDVQLYVSGPPCQSFSCIGKRLGARDSSFDVFLNVLA